MRRYLVITFIVLIVSASFVWFISVYRSADRQFMDAYLDYRSIEQPDPSKLDEWDRQMTEAYITMKEAFTAGNKEQALSHQRAFRQIIGAQEQFGLRMNSAYARHADAMPGLRTKAAVLEGKKKTLAGRIVKNESNLLDTGKDLNAGTLDEMRLWRMLDDNFSRFLDGKIDGSTFLANENNTGKMIETLRGTQVKPGQKAKNLLETISAEWNQLKPLL